MSAKARTRRAPAQRHPARSVYQASAALNRVTVALVLILSAAAIAFAYFSTNSLISTVFCALPIGLFFLVVLSYLWYTARHTALTLSADGIEYRSARLTVRSSWENIERLDGMPFSPRLLLRRPVPIEQQAGRRELLPDQSAGGRAIPLRLFGFARDSALGRDLARYAPHLFDEPLR